MPRGGPRGNKKSHKGQRRHFTSEDELKAQVARQEKQKEWRRMKGIESDEDEEEDKKDGATGEKTKDGDVEFAEESSESETDSEEEDDGKAKGVAHLIAIENPNHITKKSKKVTTLTLEGEDSKPVLTRREKEEIDKQQARAHYQKLHLAGKTEEARSDMARLALIKKEREEAAKKRDDEKKVAEDKKKLAEQKLLQKKAQASK